MMRSSSIPTELLERAAQEIIAAESSIAITGAGISTPSGIPDFRSPQSGLWTEHSPLEVASLRAFRTHPERFFDWLRPFVKHLIAAQPNPAHIALARLENHHRLHMILTQNIDALHQRAGSSAVVELHGCYQTLTCLSCCQQTQASSDLLHAYVNQGDIPRCPQCENPLKPDVILFEEQLPGEEWHQARDAAKHCDLMLVLGSSMTTAPACNLPLIAANSGAKLILINKTATPLDPNADILIQGDLAKILPDIEKRVLTND